MERKIGEIFEYKGEWYQCVNTGFSCADCDIKGDCSSTYIGACSSRLRKDEKRVVFKKLEKVGEPFIIYGKKYQVYITHVQPYILNEPNSMPVDDSIVIVEIKQTKKDMEEYKMYDAKEDIPEFDKVVDECLFGEDKPNLKPFDLEAAKLGKPVCTRDGRKARIICFDAEGNKPLIVLSKIDGKEIILRYTEKGQSDNYHSPTPREDDLMMLPEKKEGYANIVKEALSDDKVVLGRIFDNYEDAFRSGEANERYIATVKIQWEE